MQFDLGQGTIPACSSEALSLAAGCTQRGQHLLLVLSRLLQLSVPHSFPLSYSCIATSPFAATMVLQPPRSASGTTATRCSPPRSFASSRRHGRWMGNHSSSSRQAPSGQAAPGSTMQVRPACSHLMPASRALLHCSTAPHRSLKCDNPSASGLLATPWPCLPVPCCSAAAVPARAAAAGRLLAHQGHRQGTGREGSG